MLVCLGTLRIASSCCIDEGHEHWVFAVNRSFAAAGDVVDAGDRVSGMTSWCYEELGSSVVDNVLRVLFSFPFPIINFVLQHDEFRRSFCTLGNSRRAVFPGVIFRQEAPKHWHIDGVLCHPSAAPNSPPQGFFQNQPLPLCTRLSRLIQFATFIEQSLRVARDVLPF